MLMRDTNLEQTVWLMKDTVEVASRASSLRACIRLPGFTRVRHGQHPVPAYAPVCLMDLLSQKGMRKQLESTATFLGDPRTVGPPSYPGNSRSGEGIWPRLCRICAWRERFEEGLKLGWELMWL